MPGPDECIIKACEDSWDKEFLAGTPNSKNCSGFVKSVCKLLGVPMDETAQADGIVKAMSSWAEIATGKEAAQKAASGKLVLAGLTSADHTPKAHNGHVVVVVSGELYRSKYPQCWGGSIGSAQSKGTKSVGECWNRTDRDKVKYYAYSSLQCNAKTS
jgi:hypothetical protein